MEQRRNLFSDPRQRGLRPFPPGQSGNPAGRKPMSAAEKLQRRAEAAAHRELRGEIIDAVRIAQRFTPAAVYRLVELVKSKDENVALKAAAEILDRGGVIKRTAVELSADNSKVLIVSMGTLLEGAQKLLTLKRGDVPELPRDERVIEEGAAD